MRARLLAAENRKWWTLAALSFALFMIMLDNTVVNVALPSIQRDLGIGVAELEWVVTGYALSFAVLMLTGGKLADMVGRRLIFLLGLAVFTISSLALRPRRHRRAADRRPRPPGCRSGDDDAGDALDHLGHLPAAERGPRSGSGPGVSAIALAIGPLVGGLITEHISWNWIFYINVPVGILGLVAGWLIIPESQDTSHEQRLDLPGLAHLGHRALRARLRADRGEQHGLDVAADPRPLRGRRGRGHRVRPARAAPAAADVRRHALP